MLDNSAAIDWQQMKISLSVITKSAEVQWMVADFARGLGCTVDVLPPGDSIRAELPNVTTILELLDYVALSATKAGVDPAEPLCRITYRHAGAPTEVTLGLRVTEFSLKAGVPERA